MAQSCLAPGNPRRRNSDPHILSSSLLFTPCQGRYLLQFWANVICHSLNLIVPVGEGKIWCHLFPHKSSRDQSVAGADPASSPSAAKWGDCSHNSGNDNVALVCTGSINILKVALHALHSCKKFGFRLQSVLMLEKFNVPYRCDATVPACLRKRHGSGPKNIQASHMRFRGNLDTEAKSWALKGPIHPPPPTEGTPGKARTFSKPAGTSPDGVQKGYRLPPIRPTKLPLNASTIAPDGWHLASTEGGDTYPLLTSTVGSTVALWVFNL